VESEWVPGSVPGGRLGKAGIYEGWLRGDGVRKVGVSCAMRGVGGEGAEVIVLMWVRGGVAGRGGGWGGGGLEWVRTG